MKRKLPLLVVTLFTFIALSVAISTMTYAAYNEVSGKYDGSTLKMQLSNPGGSYGHYGMRVVDASGHIIHDGNMRAFSNPYGTPGGAIIWTAYNLNLDVNQLSTYILEAYVEQQTSPIATGTIQFVDTPLDNDSGSGISMLIQPHYDSSAASVTISGKGELSIIFSEYNATKEYVIQEVLIKEGISSIGDKTFSYCTGLSTISIPVSVKTIGNGAFQGCGQFTVNYSGSEEEWNAITIKNNNEPLKAATINYAKKTSGTCGATGSNLTWTFQDGALTISGSGAMADFEGGYDAIPWYYLRDKIEQIKLPSGLTKISSYAFCDCTYVTSIKVPEGVTEIGSYAFKIDCIKRVDIPDSLTKIGTDAFLGCPIEEVHYAGTINRWQMMNIADGNSSLINATRIYDVTTGHSIIKFEANGGNGKIEDIVFDPNITLELPKNTFTAPSGKLFKEWMVEGKRYKPGEHCQFTKNATVKAIWYTVLNDISFHYPSCVNGFQKWSGRAVTESYDNAGLSYYLTEGLSYNDTWFSQSSKHYEHDLATLSMAMAMAAHEWTVDKEVGDAYGMSYEDWINENELTDSAEAKEQWESNKAWVANELQKMAVGMSAGEMSDGEHLKVNGTRLQSHQDWTIKEFFKTLQFDVENSYYSIGYGADDNDSIAFAICAKKIDVGETEPVTLLAIALRGGGYGAGGWSGNADVGADTLSYHAGFRKASLFAEQRIWEYLQKHKEINPKTMRIWITGFSRSAATANLLAASLGANCPCEHIFTYTFATPNNELVENFGSTPNYIFNIINPFDLVPMVAPEQWHFSKRGTTYRLFNDLENDSKNEAFRKIFQVLAGNDENGNLVTYETPNPNITSYMLNAIMECIGDRASFFSHLQTPLAGLLSHDFSALNQIFLNVTTVEELAEIWEAGGVKRLVLPDKFLKIYQARRIAYGDSDPYLKLLSLCMRTLTCALESYDDPNSNLNHDVMSFLFDLIQNKYGSKLFKQHWPEVYLAKMLSGELKKEQVSDTYKLVSAVCPADVDVEVYDKNNNLVARTKVKTFSADIDGSQKTYTVSAVDQDATSIEMAVLGDNKLFILPDNQEYRIAIKANEQHDDEMMSYSVTSYSNGTESSTIAYQAVPLLKNSSFSAKVTTSEQSITSCTLSNGAEQLKPTKVEHYDVLLGDFNGDNKVNVDDVSDILDHIVNETPITEKQRKAADVNHDDHVNVDDVSDILDHIVNETPLN